MESFSPALSYSQLLTITSTPYVPTEPEELSGVDLEQEKRASINESDDDPHRLARVNLERYGESDGAAIRYWRSEWYTWKPSRACYRLIDENELKAKLTESIRSEFEKCWAEKMERYEERLKAGTIDDDEMPPQVQKVGKQLVTNVLAAMASMTYIPFSVDPMTWIDSDTDTRERRNYIGMLNGVIDLDALLEDKPAEDCILPHSSNWFSTIRLPYAFDPKATCPKFDAFLEKNLEMDPERIKRLQEWAGYCLLPDTGQQKFLSMEGHGSNGKSVFCAALVAMLGIENCSHISLERFGERFERTETLGKLVNVCADVGEIDRVAEGLLKSFTSGDTMFFDRKHVKGLSCIPTARLVLCWNNRPRLADKSDGIWRRMLLVPWRIEVSEKERTPNMDKPWWWEKSGELPGIFRWAIIGLHRLRNQGRFTDSKLSDEASEDYRNESNPAREFLRDHFVTSESSIRCSMVYHFYCLWCKQTGHEPMGDRMFGREVKRAFRGVSRDRARAGEALQWRYKGLSFACTEIYGQKTDESNF